MTLGGAFGTSGPASGCAPTALAYASCTGPRVRTSTPCSGAGGSARCGATTIKRQKAAKARVMRWIVFIETSRRLGWVRVLPALVKHVWEQNLRRIRAAGEL